MCTKNIVELVQFDSISLCLNFSIISSGSIKESAGNNSTISTMRGYVP